MTTIDLGWAKIVINDDKSFDILAPVNKPVTAEKFEFGKATGAFTGSALKVSLRPERPEEYGWFPEGDDNGPAYGKD
jgi:hypothetical protein